MRVIDVGQGQAVLFVGRGGESLLVDSGPSGAAEAVLRALELHGIESVNLGVHTHFDADHVGGYARLLQGMDGRLGTNDDLAFQKLWDRGIQDLPDTDAVALYFLLSTVRRTPEENEIWEVGSIRATALWPEAADAQDENDRGFAMCVELGSMRVLVLGDLGAQRAEQVAGSCTDVEILIAGHHGAEDAISTKLLDLVRPELVIVSAGRENLYCHPSPATLARLGDIPLWTTGIAGADPRSPCSKIVQDWKAHHNVVGGDIWVPLQ